MTRFGAFACGVLLAFVASVSARDLSISISEQASLPNSSGSYLWAINNQGQVAGHSQYFVNGGYYYHATVWTAGIPHDIHDPVFRESAAYGINDAGEVVGEVWPWRADSGAFIWRGGAMQSITGGPDVFYIQGAWAINNAGIVVGSGNSGYRWQNGLFQFLGILASDWSARPVAINDRGEAVGSIYGRDGTIRAAIWTGTTPSTIPAPGGALPCQALAINANSEVVGIHSYYSSSPKPFIWDREGGARPLPLPVGAQGAYPESINADGTIVGRIDGRPALWAKVEEGYEAFYLDDYLPPDSGWTRVSLSAINDHGQIAGYGTRNGSSRAFIVEFSLDEPEMELRRVDRDDPFATWSSATVVSDPQPVYAGDSTGDLISWRIKNAPRGATFKWTATQTEGLARKTISGPKGLDRSEWLLNDGSFAWPPGIYHIECTITPESGLAQSVVADQVVGWRSQEYLVVGQVKPIQDYSLSPFRKLILKHALIRSYDFGSTYLDVPTKIALNNNFSVEENAKIWVAYQFLRYRPEQGEPQYVELRGVRDTDKYWMIQQLLSEFPDLIDLPDNIDPNTYASLREQKSYRMFGHIQYRYRLAADGKFEPESVATIRKAWESGPTKFLPAPKVLVGTHVSARGTELTVEENADQVWISSEPIPNGGGIYINAENTSLSFYFGGRVGLEGRVPNYALLHRDAPYIYTEIVSAIGPDGRDTRSKIRLSVDKTWRPDGTVVGNTHFNEIRIYKRNFEDDQRRFRLVDGGKLQIAGQLEGFLMSGSTAWPGTAPEPQGDN